MARAYGDYLQRGATVAAVVVDPSEQNAAMVAKLALPFPVLSDPDGAGASKPFDVWDEGGAMARPALIVLAPDGQEVFRYVGSDFMDRPGDDEVLQTLDGLALPPLAEAPGRVPHLPPTPGRRATKLADLGVYMRGVRFAMQAMAGRARDPWDRTEAERTARMAERYIAAKGATMRAVERRSVG